MVALLKFLFYFFLTLLILGFVSRLLFRVWFKRVFRRVNENAENRNQHSNRTTDTRPRKKKVIDRNEGEYVDFEEVK